MKWLYLFILTAGACIQGSAQDVSNKRYGFDPADSSAPGIPLGELLSFRFDHSAMYPGTSRSYEIYIPAQYKPGKPACLYVCMDGVLFNAPKVFDYLIARGEMPVTIGVFIQSGTLLKNDSTVIRYNRTNEFDNLNDHFVRFIEEEILPDVVRQKASDGRTIALSASPADRMIAGASSGAICAFTAAWQRPDRFSRVFSAIGTYVGMRGGDQYPVLVRKTDPKPIRVYLQDNNNDTWNPIFGNWFKANIDLEAALNFSGYELSNMWQEGGHDGRQATSIFADAMRWLWKGWPGPVKAGWSGNDMLRQILDSTQGWEPATGESASQPLNEASVVRLAQGDQYEVQSGGIFYRPKGKKPAVADKDPNVGNALAVSPDQQQLVASIRHSDWLFDYIIGPDGLLRDKQRLYWLHNPGNDDSTEVRSLAFDTDGNLYAATAIGVQVCDQNGRVRAILSPPGGAVSRLWFGGEGYHTLYALSGAKLYQRRLKAQGAVSVQPPVAPRSQGAG